MYSRKGGGPKTQLDSLLVSFKNENESGLKEGFAEGSRDVSEASSSDSEREEESFGVLDSFIASLESPSRLGVVVIVELDIPFIAD